jgi:hypothetical protein
MTVAAIGASVAGSVVGGLMNKKDSKGQTQTQTTKNEPWEAVQPYLKEMYAAGGGLLGSGVPGLAPYVPGAQYFPYQTTTAYAPDANTLGGLNQNLQFANNYLPGMVDAQFGSYYDMLNAPDVANNPYVQAMNAATTRDLTTSGLQQAGLADYLLGNQLQDFGLASGQATDYLGRTLGNAVQNFGLAGTQQQELMSRVLGNRLEDFQLGYENTRDDMTRTLQRDWLPGVRSGAGLAGQYGSSRQGIAEGVAMGDAFKHLTDYGKSFNNEYGQAYEGAGQNIANTLANLGRDYAQTYESGAANTANTISNLGRDYSQAYQAKSLGLSNTISNLLDTIGNTQAQTNLGAYGQGLNAQQNAMQMAPNIAQLGMLPGKVQGGVGSALDAFRQQQIDADKARWDYEQAQEQSQFLDAERRAQQNYQNQWWPLQQQNALLGGFPTSSTQTGTTTQPGNWMQGAMGGAMLGSSLYNAFANPLATAFNGAMNPQTNMMANPGFTQFGGGLFQSPQNYFAPSTAIGSFGF